MNDSLPRRSITKLTALIAVGVSALLGWFFGVFDLGDSDDAPSETSSTFKANGASAGLPDPHTAGGDKQVATAIAERRSRREYESAPLTAAELGQLLWAAQGITKRRAGGVDFRAAPSAGATYPLEVFVVIGTPGVSDFDPGIYHYDPNDHVLELIEQDNVQPDLQAIALDQDCVGTAALNIIITGIDERTTERYGNRGKRRYVPIEAGHVGENIYLQSESLGLSTVAVGAFQDTPLRNLLDITEEYRPLLIYPVGRGT